MGFGDLLTGKTQALNLTVMPAAERFSEVALSQPEGSFHRLFLKTLTFGAWAFLKIHFDHPGTANMLKVHIKSVTPTSAWILVRLVALHHTLTFAWSDQHADFFRGCNTAPEDFAREVIGALQFEDDIRAATDELVRLFPRPSSDSAASAQYSLKWCNAFWCFGLLQPEKPDLPEALMTRSALGSSYDVFLKMLERDAPA